MWRTMSSGIHHIICILSSYDIKKYPQRCWPKENLNVYFPAESHYLCPILIEGKFSSIHYDCFIIFIDNRCLDNFTIPLFITTLVYMWSKLHSKPNSYCVYKDKFYFIPAMITAISSHKLIF